MRHEHQLASANRLIENEKEAHSEFWDGVLTRRALDAMSRVRGSRLSFRQASFQEALELVAGTAGTLQLAAEADVAPLVAKNPQILQVARGMDGQPVALLAFLPLNEFGAAMLVEGHANPIQPDPAWITRPTEQPAAIYVWLYYGPGKNIRCLEAMGEVFQGLCPSRCPIFSRGVTSLSEQMQLKLGTFRASLVYPHAPDWLLVALPQTEHREVVAAARMLEVRPVHTIDALMQVISIRSATYIAEQLPRHAEEFDGNDLCSSHFIAYIDDDPAGAIRIRYFGEFAKVERLAVKKEYRRSRAAFALCKAAFTHARRKGFNRIYGHASDEIVPFWRHMGAKPLPNRPTFSFANVEYHEMYCELDPDPLAVRFGANPMVTIRPEGLWDEPSPLDWSNLHDDPTRRELMAKCGRSGRA